MGVSETSSSNLLLRLLYMLEELHTHGEPGGGKDVPATDGDAVDPTRGWLIGQTLWRLEAVDEVLGVLHGPPPR